MKKSIRSMPVMLMVFGVAVTGVACTEQGGGGGAIPVNDDGPQTTGGSGLGTDGGTGLGTGGGTDGRTDGSTGLGTDGGTDGSTGFGTDGGTDGSTGFGTDGGTDGSTGFGTDGGTDGSTGFGTDGGTDGSTGFGTDGGTDGSTGFGTDGSTGFGTDGGTGGGSGETSAGISIELLQLLETENRSEGTGVFLWLCSASERRVNAGYEFESDSDFEETSGAWASNIDIEANTLEGFGEFRVIGGSLDSLLLDYSEEGAQEDISSIRFDGASRWTGFSSTEGELDCALTNIPDEG